MFLVALRVINHELTKYTLQDLQRAVEGVEKATLLGAIVAVVVCYVALTFNDRFALYMLGKRLPFARTARASFAAYALANTLGYSWATAGTARLRLYRKWGLLTSEIGALSFITGTGVQVGGLAAAGLGLMIAAPEVALHGPLNASFWWGIGLLALVPGASWLAFAKYGPAKAEIGGGKLNRPPLKRASTHLGIILIDWLGAAGVLYLLLPDHGGWSFPAFIAVYVLAGMLGALSGAPGGLGVFEAAILTLAPVSQDTPGAAIALLIYRLLYNLIPLGVAVLILGLDHAAPAARPAGRAVRAAGRIGSRVSVQLGEATQEFAPRICGILVFAAGFGILASIATPAFTARLDQLAAMGLTAIAELNHIAAGIIGALLLFIAAWLWQGSRKAWFYAVLTLATGALIGLLKGLDWEESAVLVGVVLIVLALREGFAREQNNLSASLTPAWLAVIIGGFVTTAWLANFSYQDIIYQPQFWLDFTRENDAARTFRGFAAAIVTCCLVLVLRFSRPSSPDENNKDSDN